MGFYDGPGSREPKVGEGEEYELNGNAERLYTPWADAKIVGWRLEYFEALGFNRLQATSLAMRRDVDREEVQRLIESGATPEQVVGIVL